MNDLEVPELFPLDLLPYEAKLLLDAVRMAVDVPDIADSDLGLYERLEAQLAAIARTGRYCTCLPHAIDPDCPIDGEVP